VELFKIDDFINMNAFPTYISPVLSAIATDKGWRINNCLELIRYFCARQGGKSRVTP
jgi:hypothetical protein